jgi:long-chain-alcohol oxidase
MLQTQSVVQMGTCRMGADKTTSVVDTRGECWDVEGLWVADASLLPTATGVNPMITTEAMALCVAENLASELLGKPFELLPSDVELCCDKFEW